LCALHDKSCRRTQQTLIMVATAGAVENTKGAHGGLS
jgi:hypothetical protein